MRIESGELAGRDLCFDRPFRIGRGSASDVRFSSRLVSRRHAEVFPKEGQWWIRDPGSGNGLLLNGELIAKAEMTPLRDGDLLRLGREGPELRIQIQSAEEERRVRTLANRGDLKDEIVKKFLNEENGGERTKVLRQAVQEILKGQKRTLARVLLVLGMMLLGSLAYGLSQKQRMDGLDRRAAEGFRTMRSMEVQLVNLRQEVEQSGSSQQKEQLEAIDSLRRRYAEEYDGYISDQGFYQKLKTRDEQLIFRTARLFRECEFDVSRTFVAAVLREINDYWLTPRGRGRFQQAIERAEGADYTRRIVAALKLQGVPPEFFYLALQESDFRVGAVGVPTRLGYAKGMWQFIPTTALRYGLTLGPLTETGLWDPQDHRHDFQLSSDAAARYLRDLHGVLTQASGLLVMAAYNWGEHRIQPRLERLPTPADLFEASFAEVPADPAFRNYRTFLEDYGDRMPDETKDYVLKVFSAAVIGQDPRHFGFDFANPLEPYKD